MDTDVGTGNGIRSNAVLWGEDGAGKQSNRHERTQNDGICVTIRQILSPLRLHDRRRPWWIRRKKPPTGMSANRQTRMSGLQWLLLTTQMTTRARFAMLWR